MPIRSRLQVLVVAGFLLALCGYFAPWVAHRTAALSLSGWELLPWAKPLPEVRSGELLLRAPWLYAPLVAAGVGLALAGAAWRPRDWRGWALRLAGVGLSLLALPPYPAILGAYRNDPEFGGQFYLALAGVLLCLSSVLAWRMPAILRAAAALACAAAGAYFAPAMFTWMLPAIDRVYHEPIGWGWGVWLSIAGFLLAGVAGLSAARR